MKKAKRIPSGTSEEENALLDTGDGTDVEQHESLPYDLTKKQQDLQAHKVTAKKILKYKKAKKDNKKKTQKEKQSTRKDREDSVTSGWSEIPEIRIIQTESAERLDNVEIEKKKDNLAISPDDEGAESLNVANKSKKGNKNVDKGKKPKDRKTNQEKNKKEREPKNGINGTKKFKNNNGKSGHVSKRQLIDNIGTCEPEVTKAVKNADVEDKQKNKVNTAGKKAPIPKVKESDKIFHEHEKQRSDTSNSENSEENNKIDVLSESDYEDEEGIIENEENSHENTDDNGGDNDDDDDASEELFNSDDERNKSEDEDKSEDSTTMNSVENRKDEPTKISSQHKHRRNIDERDNEVSNMLSQNTVEHVEVQKVRKEIKGKPLERKNETDESIHLKNKHEKDQKSSQKAMARMKIAKVLLNEARRRSSSGLDEM